MKNSKISRKTTKSGRAAGAGARRRRPSEPSLAPGETPVTPPTAVQSTPDVSAAGAPRRERPWLWYVAIGATVVFLVIFVVFIFRMMTTIEQQNQQLIVSTRAFGEMNKRLMEARSELARKDDLLRVLSAPRVSMVTLQGSRMHRSARGKIIWDPDNRSAILQVSNLPPVPDGKEYQLWLVRGGRELSAGVFAVTGGSSNLFRVDSLPVLTPRGTSTVAVTLERKGGTVRPVGEVYLTGTATI